MLIFDEYGRVKYHVHNDVFGAAPDRSGSKYLWEIRPLRAAPAAARLRGRRLSAMHRLRALDARRFPAEGW